MRILRSTGSDRGFTLIELMIAVAVLGILSSMAVVQIGYSRPAMLADGIARNVMVQLNSAREMAVAERRRMDIDFIGTNAVRITRREVPNGTTIVRQIPFEGGVRFGLVSGVGDTPDAFGNATATSFSGAASITFNTDGMLIDNGGRPVNGSIFLVIPGAAGSYRAVTVMGSTGRVRAYRWTGTQWIRM